MPATIRSVPLGEWWDPEHVFSALYRDTRYVVWLDAGAGAGAAMSYLGAADAHTRLVTASVAAGTVTTTVPGDPRVPPITAAGTIFDFLRDELAELDGPAGEPPGLDDPSGLDGTARLPGGFRLGWVGWLGYALTVQTTGVPVHPSHYPDAALLHLDRVIAFDHAERTVTLLLRNASEEECEKWAAAVQDALAQSGEGASPRPGGTPAPAPAPAPPPAAPPASGPTALWRHGDIEYAALIRQCQDAIAAGDAYQLCLTNEIRVEGVLDPVDTYQRLRTGSPTHHGGLLRFGDTALLSASPEQFLTVSRTGRLSTRPMKGTRPRAADAVEDQRLRVELEASDKERAENLMIVDLMRNDLARVAAPGSVVVSQLLAVETYAQVHQLVSTIEGQLAKGKNAVDVVAACFPAGSMTGAPKISAIALLDRLEAGPRGTYAGAFGYFGHDGAIDLAMVIRSIVLDRQGATIGTGGGITALSVPADEVEETRVKAAALLRALGVADAAQ